MWQRINKIGWTIWSWLSFATTIRSIRQPVPPPFMWWWASHQLSLQLWPHTGNPQMMQVRKCQWSHNLMNKGDAYGRWLRPILKRCTNGTRILWTSPDERWTLEKETKCGLVEWQSISKWRCWSTPHLWNLCNGPGSWNNVSWPTFPFHALTTFVSSRSTSCFQMPPAFHFALGLF